MTEPTPEPPVTDPNPSPEEPPEEPAPDPEPTDPDPAPEDPPGEEPEFCTSAYPANPSITCELPYGHSVRMIHRRNYGPDVAGYEWE